MSRSFFLFSLPAKLLDVYVITTPESNRHICDNAYVIVSGYEMRSEFSLFPQPFDAITAHANAWLII